ncbi:MAG: hypothetical protein EOL88_00690 [Bacteroidia bacterium]|nr:hypothetical protein [Bacteroidia bacterium]
MAKTKTATKKVAKTTKKKVAKKTSQKKATRKPRESKQVKELKLALVETEQKAEDLSQQLNKALVVESKKSLVKPVFDLKVLLKMAERTPAQYIKQRKGPSGTMLSYVEGGYMKTALNYLFGWRWDFEIIDKGEVKVGNKVVQVWVQGKLIIKDENNNVAIVKSQFGGASVKYLKSNTSMPVDMANDYKSASTDALKKCASELGIASDVYNKNEFIVSESNPENVEVVEGNQIEPEVVKEDKGVDYFSKLVRVLAKEAEISLDDGLTKEKVEIMVEVYNNYTGQNIKSLKIQQSTAQKYLMDFLNSPKMVK